MVFTIRRAVTGELHLYMLWSDQHGVDGKEYTVTDRVPWPAQACDHLMLSALFSTLASLACQVDEK